MYTGEKNSFQKDDKTYVVRFFDCEDSRDLRDLVLIVESPDVQRWMDEVDNLNFGSYRRWMDDKGQSNNFLFAIADPRTENIHENRVHGFVYIYPSKIQEGSLEISYAKRPNAPAGLTAPAIEIACRIVYEYLSENKPWMVSNLMILAEIERSNIPSIKVIEKAGFKMIGGFEHSKNGLWARGVDMVIKNTVLPQDGMARVRQLNNSYCGPATLQIRLQHYGIETDQEKLVAAGSSRAHVLGCGMSLEMLARAVRNLYPNMALWAKRDASLSDIEAMVREYNYPVGVDWQGVFETDDYADLPEETDVEPSIESPLLKGEAGHYSVVVDVDRANDNIRITNPYGNYSQEDQFFRVQDFLNRWWDDRMDLEADGRRKYIYENRLMFVVVPREVEAPAELGMVMIS